VQVLLGGQVLQSHGGSAGDGLAPFTKLAGLRLDHPVAVHVLLLLHARHRLLPGTRSVLDVVGVQAEGVVRVEQLQDGAAGDHVGFGGCVQQGQDRI